ncbi:MAG: LytTR family transcriptional regulator [Ruminococcaceae bacterium]|nr:LytTR family transcriptional regulator [Oscillospiraceae bacterium]
MKLYTEVSGEAQEQVVIRCRQRTEKIKLLESIIENLLSDNAELTLTDGETEYFVPKNEILFFETTGSKVAAHTADRMYYTEYRLFELEQIMAPAFQRISKSCIVNCNAICAIRKNLTGASEVMFKDCEKKVYLSRSYYHLLRDKLGEVRGLK